MKKVFNRFLTFGLSIAMLFGFITSNPLPQPTVTADAATTADSYYSGITATEDTALLGQLHDLITRTHKTYTSYKGLNSIFPKSDPGLDGKGFVEFYTHETITTGFGSAPGVGNKEHVWPKSLSKQSNGNNLWETSGAGADLLHIRPTEYTTNNLRNNDKYGEVTGGTAVNSKAGHLAGYHTGGVFEPNDNVKGDVARIVMYVYTHYNTYSNSSVFGSYASTNGSGSSSYFGKLTFTQIMSASNEAAAIDLLLEWNELDEVDDIERTRNNVAFDEQGNRNPFIDHPEFASAIWGDGTYTPDPDIGGGEEPGGGGQQGGESGEVFTPLTKPVAGTSYYLAMDVNGTYQYVTGKMVNTYYLEATTDISQAAEFTLTAQGNGWVIKTGSSFLQIALNGTHVNAVFGTSSTGVWNWDEELGIFIWDDLYYLGNFGEHTDSVAGQSMDNYKEGDYFAYLGTYGEPGESGGEGPGGEEPGGEEPGGEQGTVAAFQSAVAAIKTEGSLALRYTSLRRAIVAYNALSDADKQLVQDEYETLAAAIGEYNALVASYNEDAGKAGSGALAGVA